MLIGNLLIGTIAGSLAYVCKVIYDSNRIELDPVIEVEIQLNMSITQLIILNKQD